MAADSLTCSLVASTLRIFEPSMFSREALEVALNLFACQGG